MESVGIRDDTQFNNDELLLQNFNDTVEFNEENVDGLKHYIPHHPNVAPGHNTTKLHIVYYDGSAKSKKDDKSFNECLYRGLVLLKDLTGLLLKFQRNKIAMAAEIEKAFSEVRLRDCDRDVTRFLWLKDPSKCTTEDNIQVYRFTKIPFGMYRLHFYLLQLYHIIYKKETLKFQQSLNQICMLTI